MKSIPIRIFFGLYFPAFGLNTERCSVPFHIQSECGEIRTRKTPNTDSFHAVSCEFNIPQQRHIQNSIKHLRWSVLLSAVNLTIFERRSILDVWQGCEYASVQYLQAYRVSPTVFWNRIFVTSYLISGNKGHSCCAIVLKWINFLYIFGFQYLSPETNTSSQFKHTFTFRNIFHGIPNKETKSMQSFTPVIFQNLCFSFSSLII